MFDVVAHFTAKRFGALVVAVVAAKDAKLIGWFGPIVMYLLLRSTWAWEWIWGGDPRVSVFASSSCSSIGPCDRNQDPPLDIASRRFILHFILTSRIFWKWSLVKTWFGGWDGEG